MVNLIRSKLYGKSMRNRCTKIICVTVVILVLFPLIFLGIIGISQSLALKSAEYKIEGYEIIGIEYDQKYDWIVYKSVVGNEYKKVTLYHDELPFSSFFSVKADTDETGVNTKDAHVYSVQPNNNFGNTNTVNCTRDASAVNRAFVEWTLPSGVGTISSVVYRVDVQTADNVGDWGDFYVQESTESWEELVITWNNAPTTGFTTIDSYASTSLPGSAGWYDHELENPVSGSKLITDLGYTWGDTFALRLLIATKTGGSGDIKHVYYSRDNPTASVRPKLVVTYTLPVPDTPSITSPSNGATDIDQNPTITSSAYSGTGAHAASQWQADEDSNFGSPDWDSGSTATNLESIVVNNTNGTFQNELAGETELGFCTTYYVRVKHKNEYNQWSSWSTPISFTTVCNVAPDKPSITSPSSGATKVDNNPTSTSSPFSDSDIGDTHAASQWQIDTDIAFGSPDWDSGSTATNLVSIVVNATNGTFQNGLAGETQLNDGTLYYIKVRHKDLVEWSAWSDPIPFTTNNAPTKPSIEKPYFAEVIAYGFTFEGDTFEDADSDTHYATKWQVRRIDGNFSSPAYDSGWDTSNLLTNSAITNILERGKDYYIRIAYQDDKLLTSSWSDEQFFRMETPVTGGGGGGYTPPTPGEETVTLTPVPTERPISELLTDEELEEDEEREFSEREKPTFEFEKEEECEFPEVKSFRDAIMWIIAFLKCLFQYIYRILAYIWNWMKYIYYYIVKGMKFETPKFYKVEYSIKDYWRQYETWYAKHLESINSYISAKEMAILASISIVGTVILLWQRE